jgi:hypothetical protein
MKHLETNKMLEEFMAKIVREEGKRWKMYVNSHCIAVQTMEWHFIRFMGCYMGIFSAFLTS